MNIRKSFGSITKQLLIPSIDSYLNFHPKKMSATTQQLDFIKKYLPENLWDIAWQYDIPVNFIQNMKELVELILNSKSIDTPQEKQSWFSLLPLMNDEQIARLNDIMMKEKAKLQEIQQNYDEKKVEIKKKYLMKRQQMNQQMETTEIEKEEKAKASEESAQADALLSGLS